MKEMNSHRSIYDLKRTSPYEGPYRRPSYKFSFILIVALFTLFGLAGLLMK